MFLQSCMDLLSIEDRLIWAESYMNENSELSLDILKSVASDILSTRKIRAR